MPDDSPVYELNPGEYVRHEGDWWCCCPSGEKGALMRHEIVEHGDGSITVSPSILIYGKNTWHGYLENGVWREV